MAMIDKSYLILCFIEDLKHVDSFPSKRDNFLSQYNKWSEEFEIVLKCFNNLRKQILPQFNPSRLPCLWATFFLVLCVTESIREEYYVVCIPGLLLYILFVVISIIIAITASSFLKYDSFSDTWNFNIHVNCFLKKIEEKLSDIDKRLRLEKNQNSLKIIPNSSEEDLLLMTQRNSIFAILLQFCEYMFGYIWLYVCLASAIILSILLFTLNIKHFPYLFILALIFLIYLLLCQCLKLRRCSIDLKSFKMHLEYKKSVIFRWNSFNCCEFQSIMGKGGHNCVAFLKLIQWDSDIYSLILNPSLAYAAVVVHVACRLQRRIYSRNIEEILESLFFSF
ncbi:uncharacterized protein [Parasteatoda tepidariorum]|uniref:uncharacterized protein n=1 Tax=Parasteatoda tepidariorum TaxID=114398 RepID=UPI00077F94C9|nr:uncharacterized protein LOC107455763 [Parasteatoda tepidariorum]